MTQSEFLRKLSFELLTNLPQGTKLATYPSQTAGGDVSTTLTITFQNAEEMAFCVENLYEVFKDENDMQMIVNAMLNAINKQLTSLYSYDSEKAFLTLMSKEEYEERVDGYPCFASVDFPDLVAVIRMQVECEDENSIESIVVSHEMFKNAGTTAKDEFYELLMRNELSPKSVTPIYEDMFERGIISEAELSDFQFDTSLLPFYIYKNEDLGGIYGAAALMSMQSLAVIAQRFNCGFYIFPASTHQVTLFPESALDERWTIDAILEFNAFLELYINGAKETCSKEALLSQNVYYYDAKTKTISMVGKDRMSDKEDVDR